MAQEKSAEQRAAARLDGLRRAKVISLEALTEWRRQLVGQRHALEREQQRDRRRRRAKAREVLADLTAFGERVRGRLEEASFADKQANVQLVLECIIVHGSSLEIRHVILLRSPPPGREGSIEPNGRLRSDRVHAAALPRGGQDVGGGVLEAAPEQHLRKVDQKTSCVDGPPLARIIRRSGSTGACCRVSGLSARRHVRWP